MRKLVRSIVYEGEKVKGSRFIASLFPLQNEEHKKIHLQEIKQIHPKACHHCYAFRLQNGKARSSDDGEPTGSAGLPILRRIESFDAFDILLVVTRYFGGVKLGIGGLVRAYGTAAKSVLSRGEFITSLKKVQMRIESSYSDSNIVKSVLRTVEDAKPRVQYGEQVFFQISLPVTDCQKVKDSLKDRSSGRIKVVLL